MVRYLKEHLKKSFCDIVSNTKFYTFESKAKITGSSVLICTEKHKQVMMPLDPLPLRKGHWMTHFFASETDNMRVGQTDWQS